VKELLDLLGRCLGLFEPGCFRIVDSAVSDGLGEASITLESPLVRVLFTRDRFAHLAMQFQFLDTDHPHEWFLSTALRGALDDEPRGSRPTDPAWPAWFEGAMVRLHDLAASPRGRAEIEVALHEQRGLSRLEGARLMKERRAAARGDSGPGPRVA
jgi:hypothetical protein